MTWPFNTPIKTDRKRGQTERNTQVFRVLVFSSFKMTTLENVSAFVGFIIFFVVTSLIYNFLIAVLFGRPLTSHSPGSKAKYI